MHDMKKRERLIGENIRNARKKRGLTQEQLADKIGKNSNLLARYEQGKVKILAETLSKIATALNMSSSELLGENVPFTKDFICQDETQIKDVEPTMAYWGTVIDNAAKVSKDNPNIEFIFEMIKKAADTVQKKISNEEKQKEQITPTSEL